MINKPNNWDNTAAVIGSGYKNLPAGNYKCKIVGCETTQSKNGNQMLKIAFDINEGEYTGISNINATSTTANKVYDLMGREVKKAVKGIYIMNNKKVIIK